LQTAVRLNDILSSARGGAATAAAKTPLVFECSATQPTGITLLMEQIARMTQEIQRSKCCENAGWMHSVVRLHAHLSLLFLALLFSMMVFIYERFA
jgi:putative protein kinase ArgK-like GTPase of G3E family